MNRHAERQLLTRTYNRDRGQTPRTVLVLDVKVCAEHRAYETWAEAEFIARRTMDDITVRRQLLAYRCEFCNRWHVGGDAPRIRNRALTGKRGGWASIDRVLLPEPS